MLKGWVSHLSFNITNEKHLILLPLDCMLWAMTVFERKHGTIFLVGQPFNT